MPVLIAIPPDPTDLVLQGEQLRQAVLDPNNIPDVAVPLLQGGQPMLLGFPECVTDEDAFPPMNTYCEVGSISVRRSKNGILQQRVNAGISTPCGAWIVNDFSPLLLQNERLGAYSKFSLVGVTRDSAGAALGGVTVKVFRADGDSITPFTAVSDGSGNFSLDVGAERGPFYYRDDKAGSPYKAGTSINTITPTES